MNAQQYLAYLLRLWRAKQNNENGWRASLESPHTGEVRGFASLDLLVEFLREQTQKNGEEKVQKD
jgi:hypothetical protein